MKKNNKGFTLAELLIVVAIIAVLTAIAIPVFSTQLEKAKEATDLANLRAAYSECSMKVLEDGKAYCKAVTMQSKGKFDSQGADAAVKVGSFEMKDVTVPDGKILYVNVSAEGAVTVGAKTDGYTELTAATATTAAAS